MRECAHLALMCIFVFLDRLMATVPSGGVIYPLIRDRFLFFVSMDLKRLGIGIRDVSNKFGLVG